MPRPSFRHAAVPLDPILDAAAALARGEGVVLLVRAFAGRLERPIDREQALRCAELLDRAPAVPAASAAARLVETLARLHEQLRLNRSDPRGWTAAQRVRVFDPDWLVRRCLGEKLLAAAAHRAWRDAASRLRDAGEDVSALAWSALTGGSAPARGRAAWVGAARAGAARARAARISGAG